MSEKIPQPRGLPLLGNISEVDFDNPWEPLKKLAEKYGEIFQLTVLGKRTVFVTNAALTEEVCDEKRFRKCLGAPSLEIRATAHNALFSADSSDPEWGIAHRILRNQFSAETLAGHVDEMRDIAAEMLGRWKDLGEANTIAPLADLRRLWLECTAQVFFGKRLHSLDKDHPWIQAQEDVEAECFKRSLRPGFVNALFFPHKLAKASDRLRSLAADLVQYRKDNPTDRQDFLASLLTGKDPETGTALTESQVIDEIATMHVASSTVYSLTTSIIFHLSSRPDIVALAREEIASVLPGNEPPQAPHLERMVYIAAIVREVLRLASSVPGFNRQPVPRDDGDKSPLLLAGGKYQVAHDQEITVLLPGVNRDPDVWHEPEAFKPERMLGEAFDKLPDGAKHSFGAGIRVCIGTRYAMQFCVLVACLMIRDLDFEVADPDYKPATDGWFILRPVGFTVKVKPRAT